MSSQRIALNVLDETNLMNILHNSEDILNILNLNMGIFCILNRCGLHILLIHMSLGTFMWRFLYIFSCPLDVINTCFDNDWKVNYMYLGKTAGRYGHFVDFLVKNFCGHYLDVFICVFRRNIIFILKKYAI